MDFKPEDVISEKLPEPGAPVIEWMIEGMDPLEQACRRIEAVVDEEGWDCRPHFYTLSLLGAVAAKAQAGDGPIVGGMCLNELTMPDFCYDDPAGGIWTLMQFLGEEFRGGNKLDLLKIMHAITPPDFFGFGMVYEGWTLPDTVSSEEVKQRSREHTIDQHPDRVEMRGLTFATRDGRIVTLVRKRGQAPIYVELDPTEGDLWGRVPDGVRQFTSLLEGFDKWREKAAMETGT